MACSREVLVKLTKFVIASSVGSDVMLTVRKGSGVSRSALGLCRRGSCRYGLGSGCGRWCSCFPHTHVTPAWRFRQEPFPYHVVLRQHSLDTSQYSISLLWRLGRSHDPDWMIAVIGVWLDGVIWPMQ